MTGAFSSFKKSIEYSCTPTSKTVQIPNKKVIILASFNSIFQLQFTEVILSLGDQNLQTNG